MCKNEVVNFCVGLLSVVRESVGLGVGKQDLDAVSVMVAVGQPTGQAVWQGK